jgi:hypothetical protein
MYRCWLCVPSNARRLPIIPRLQPNRSALVEYLESKFQGAGRLTANQEVAPKRRHFRIGDYTTGTGEWLPNPNGEAPSLMRLVQQQECCRGTLCDELFPPALTAILDFYWTMRRSAPLCKYGNFWA